MKWSTKHKRKKRKTDLALVDIYYKRMLFESFQRLLDSMEASNNSPFMRYMRREYVKDAN